MKDRFALHVEPMGRHAAGAALVRAIGGSGDLSTVGCFAASQVDAGACERALREHGFGGEVEWVGVDRPQQLERFGVLFHPGPGLDRLAWRRLGLGERRYSLCGLTHAIASHADMSAIASLPVAPLRSWDALICSSRVVRDGVREMLERQADYLRARLGAQRFELPQLPLIPLGVHCQRFPVRREPAPMRAAGLAPRRTMSSSCASAACPFMRKRTRNRCSARSSAPTRAAARCTCCCAAGSTPTPASTPSARPPRSWPIGAPDGARWPRAGIQAGAWAAADIYTSLADNVQESFGMTPLEAMAAGLPCVVSDWNGYRDTVRDGVDGYRIPTVMPGAGAGLDLAQRYDDGVDNYDEYCGHTSQAVALDGAQLTQAYGGLIRDAGLRRQMGECGRQRARAEFDWQVVLRRYRALWSELDERRRADALLAPALPQTVPDRLDPFALFASWPSAQLAPESLVELAPDASLAQLRAYRELGINRFATSSLPTLEEFGQIFGSIESRPMQVDELLDTLGPCDRPTLLRGLVWLCKMDLLRISENI
jgi:starch synthase